MRVAIIGSNSISIRSDAKKGTEIFSHILITHLANHMNENNLQITAFASGDSQLPVPIESVSQRASFFDEDIPEKKHIIFELALLSKAFSQQEKFDLYHVNIGDGDIALPFAPFVKKPILITLHNTAHEKYLKRYLSLYKDMSNVFFVSISKAQRKLFPTLNYIATIYHGIDASDTFTFNQEGGESIIWAGRGVPKKGMDVVIQIAQKLQKKAQLFALVKNEHHKWLNHQIENIVGSQDISIKLNVERHLLVGPYQNSKLFLFPLEWEEPFGLVIVEAMASGTPVVAYSRGSMPELIEDGKTGFLVNPSTEDIRGEWIVKKTGVEGLQEAVERIYAMSGSEYQVMRQACRNHVEENFTADKMAKKYIKVYENLVGS
jgi:glycosyltransferase involved in cell wall biosynthesis